MKKSGKHSLSGKNSMKGLSLLEILITVGIFAVIGILVTRATFLSLRGSQKGGTTIKVRENLDYAISIIERQLRNARSITSCSETKLVYEDNIGEPGYFECVGLGGDDGYVASGSSRLTAAEAVISTCSFACTDGSASTPPQIQIDISSGGIDITTKIDLRTY